MQGTALATDAGQPGAQQPKAGSACYIVFAGELDKQLMAFTLANTAAASGMPTQMFFTFWGVSALRRAGGGNSRGKGLIARMFGCMLPSSSRKLRLSKMNFGGFGTRLIRWQMKRKGAASLEEQIEVARQLGVEFLVCDTSMDLMGFRLDDFVDGVTVAGAAHCLKRARDAEVSMVIG